MKLLMAKRAQFLPTIYTPLDVMQLQEKVEASLHIGRGRKELDIQAGEKSKGV